MRDKTNLKNRIKGLLGIILSVCTLVSMSGMNVYASGSDIDSISEGNSFFGGEYVYVDISGGTIIYELPSGVTATNSESQTRPVGTGAFTIGSLTGTKYQSLKVEYCNLTKVYQTTDSDFYGKFEFKCQDYDESGNSVGKEYVKKYNLKLVGVPYTITFLDSNEITICTKEVESVDYSEQSPVYTVVLPTAPGRDGYEFKGWIIGESESGSTYGQPGASITTSASIIQGYWEPIPQETEGSTISGTKYLGAGTLYKLPSGTHTVSGESGITYEGGSTFYVASTGYYTIN